MLLLVSFLTLVFGDLSGKYTGSKTIVGVTITQTMTFKDGMKVDFSFTGPVTINCPDEDYTLESDGTMKLTNLDTPGDCLEKNLADNDVTLKSLTYSANDEITISFKWKFLSQSLVLQKETNTFPNTILATALSGEYSGTNTIIGDEIMVSITFSDDMKAKFTLSGPLTIDCTEESYSIAFDGAISMTNIDITNFQNQGNCIRDILEATGLSVSRIKYSSKSDTIAVTVQMGFMTETLILRKVSVALIAPAVPIAPVVPQPIEFRQL